MTASHAYQINSINHREFANIALHASQACSRKTRTLPLTKPTFSTLQKCGFSAILMTFNDLISYLGSIL